MLLLRALVYLFVQPLAPLLVVVAAGVGHQVVHVACGRPAVVAR
jgi:hypothetical protein